MQPVVVAVAVAVAAVAVAVAAIVVVVANDIIATLVIQNIEYDDGIPFFSLTNAITLILWPYNNNQNNKGSFFGTAPPPPTETV